MSKLEGVVKWFSNSLGFGFINPVSHNEIDESVEYFVHFSSIKMDGFKTLNPSQHVLFDLKTADKGVQAVNVEAA